MCRYAGRLDLAIPLWGERQHDGAFRATVKVPQWLQSGDSLSLVLSSNSVADGYKLICLYICAFEPS